VLHGLIVPAAVALISGVALSGRWPHARALAELLTLAGGLACAAAFAFRGRLIASFGLVVLALPFGWWLGVRAHEQAVARPLRVALRDRLTVGREGEPVLIEARLREDVLPGEDGAVLVADVTRVFDAAGWQPREGGVRLSVRGAQLADHTPAWRRGRCVRAPALLRVPVAFRNPGVPDADLQLARRGIQLVGSIKSASLVEPCGLASPWLERAGDARDAIRSAIARHVGAHGRRSAAITAAILIGDRAAIEEEVEERLRRAGTFHVIAISGGNIAVLTSVLLWTLAGLRAPPRRAAWLTIGGLAAYAAVVVRGPSVDRALLVALVYLAAGAAGVRAHPLALLATVATAVVLRDPHAAFDLGFALTFGATAGLVAVTPCLLDGLRWVAARAGQTAPVPAPCRALVLSIVATLAAEAAVLPIGAAGFGRVTFAGVILNIVAIPLMAVVQTAGLLTALLSPLAHAAAGTTGWVAHLAVTGLVESARLADAMPWLVRPVPPPAWWLLAAYAVALSLACAPAIRVSARLSAAGLAVCGALAMSTGWCPARSDPFSARLPRRWVEPPALRVTFLDVGQGDAVLVQFPGRRAMLVDTGGLPGASRFDIGRRVVSPALHALGVRRIDWLVLTHGDPDHAGGAIGVVEDWRPGEIWEGIPVRADAMLGPVAARAARDGIPWRRARAFDEVEVEGVGIRVWHPGPADWERQRVRNDDSVVIELRLGEVSIVLPGDIGQAVERRLAEVCSLGRFVVLKAAHHGSADSSDRAWLAALRPAAVVYSAGRGNWFGHPAPRAVARARAVGAELFRTDEDGAIQVIVTADRATIASFTGRWWSRRVG
jgi:competence protein ComEC